MHYLPMIFTLAYSYKLAAMGARCSAQSIVEDNGNELDGFSQNVLGPMHDFA